MKDEETESDIQGKAIEAALSPDRKAVRQRIGHAPRPEGRRRHRSRPSPTGSIAFDLCLGIGGFPRGRVVEIYGPEATGKTTLALHVIAEAQKRGGQAAFIDAEHAMDPKYARPAGGRHRQPAHLPARLRRAGPGDRRGPRPQRRGRRRRRGLGRGPGPQGGARRRDGRRPHGPPGAAHVPGPAQAHGHRRPLQDVLHLHQPDPREDRHVHRQPRDDDRRPGAQVLLLDAHRRPPPGDHQGRRRSSSATGSRSRSSRTRWPRPSAKSQFDIIFGEGISREGDLVDCGLDHGILERTGTWYSYNGERLGQGRDNVKKLLKENKELAAKLEAEIRTKVGLGPARPRPSPRKSREESQPKVQMARSPARPSLGTGVRG